MPEKRAERLRVAPMQKFVCRSLPIPPGAKAKARLPRGEEQFVEPSQMKWWLLGGSAVGTALVAGILIGRFLIP
jgi:hypothetical protein